METCVQAAMYGICMARTLSDDRIDERIRILSRARRSKRRRRKEKITREVLKSDMKDQPQYFLRCMRLVVKSVILYLMCRIHIRDIYVYIMPFL